MYIPKNKIEISDEKITDYLLVRKEKNDKSAFLHMLGYSESNWGELVNDIIAIVESNEAYLQQNTPFGEIYEVKGNLKNFAVVTIWLLAIDSEHFRFITLFPNK